MSILFEAKGIEKNIESHSHYGPCLRSLFFPFFLIGSRYFNFNIRRETLKTCMDYNEELKNFKEQIISEYNKLKLEKKKKINQLNFKVNSLKLKNKNLMIKKRLK